MGLFAHIYQDFTTRSYIWTEREERKQRDASLATSSSTGRRFLRSNGLESLGRAHGTCRHVWKKIARRSPRRGSFFAPVLHLRLTDHLNRDLAVARRHTYIDASCARPSFTSYICVPCVQRDSRGKSECKWDSRVAQERGSLG